MTDFQKERLQDADNPIENRFKVVYSLCMDSQTHDYNGAESAQYLKLIADSTNMDMLTLQEQYNTFVADLDRKNKEIMQNVAESIEKKIDKSISALPAEEEEIETPALCCVADVEKKEIQFLIEPYIIKNNITAIVGDGGVGKTFIWVDIASAISNGKRPAIMCVPF